MGTIQPGDMVIFFNFRNDRAKELTIVLTQEDKPDFGMKTMPLYYCTMTPYDAKFKGLHILFDKENVVNTIGEYISKQGLKQLRIAETEKYAPRDVLPERGTGRAFRGREPYSGTFSESGNLRFATRNVCPYRDREDRGAIE